VKGKRDTEKLFLIRGHRDTFFVDQARVLIAILLIKYAKAYFRRFLVVFCHIGLLRLFSHSVLGDLLDQFQKTVIICLF